MDNQALLNINEIISYVAKITEVCGVLTIIIGALYSTGQFLIGMNRNSQGYYEIFRGSLGRSILLGLEFLVAGDIIGTVAIEPTFKSLGVLALIVVVRTFLSFSLEVEIKGRWPWTSPNNSAFVGKEKTEST